MTPGLKVFTSNRLELLVDELAGVCSVQLGSIFRPETVVVQSQGMSRWLSLQLADRNLICANYRFPFPNAFTHQLFKVLSADLPHDPECRLDVLLWRVMKHLPERLPDQSFADLKNYLGTANDSRKRFQLAQKIAWMFDQYLVFRPEFIERWEAGEETHWQAELWRTVSEEFKSPHRAELRKQFLERVAAGSIDRKRLPERLSVFGISALPPFHMELFAALAQSMEVNLFLLQPCREFWGYISTPRETERALRQNAGDAQAMHLESGNRLLASMGMLGRDFLHQVFAFDNVSPIEKFSEADHSTLLRTIQSDILELQDRGTAECPRQVIPATDRSIEIHSCHSAMRAVEVLHDSMLDWFQKDSTLQPRDILVLTPDLETYSPLVQAVFGCPESAAHQIPFSVADRNPRKEGQVIETFITLLNIGESRLGVVQVLTLLECGALRQKFSISESDLISIREWLEAAGIRWGIDAEHRTRFDVPAFAANSWREGLERMLLGYAMKNEGEQLFGELLPLEIVEGGAARTLGNVLAFAEKLFDLTATLQIARPLVNWKNLLRGITSDFFELDDETDGELKMIWQAVAKIHENADAAGFTGAVDLSVILELLNAEFGEDARGAGFLDGGVTFAALKPMRSLPVKVICLLGMNDGSFPRHASQLGFDLMSKEPRLGDRSTRDDDRYLFLETILSAREKLYLSYEGQSIQDNSVRPPSVLISELTDYIVQGFESEGGGNILEQVTTKHRLQAFNTSYFSGGALFSYSEQNLSANRTLQERQRKTREFFASPLPAPDESWRFVTLDQLTNFFCNPSEFIVRQRLGIRLPRQEEEMEEREPFTVDARQAYAIKQTLVEKALAGVDFEKAEHVVQASGQLPVGEAGKVVYRGLCAEVTEFVTRLQPFCPNQAVAPVTFDFSLAGFRVAGQISGITQAGLLRYRCAKLKPTDLLRLWIPHLILNKVQKTQAHAVHVALDESVRIAAMDDPDTLLTDLLQIYLDGLRSPAKFFPQTSFAFAETQHRRAGGTTKVEPIKEAARKWNDSTIRDGGGYRTLPGERNNPYIALCFGDAEPLDENFEEIAQRVFGPIVQRLQSIA